MPHPGPSLSKPPEAAAAAAAAERTALGTALSEQVGSCGRFVSLHLDTETPADAIRKAEGFPPYGPKSIRGGKVSEGAGVKVTPEFARSYNRVAEADRAARREFEEEGREALRVVRGQTDLKDQTAVLTAHTGAPSETANKPPGPSVTQSSQPARGFSSLSQERNTQIEKKPTQEKLQRGEDAEAPTKQPVVVSATDAAKRQYSQASSAGVGGAAAQRRYSQASGVGSSHRGSTAPPPPPSGDAVLAAPPSVARTSSSENIWAKEGDRSVGPAGRSQEGEGVGETGHQADPLRSPPPAEVEEEVDASEEREGTDDGWEGFRSDDGEGGGRGSDEGEKAGGGQWRLSDGGLEGQRVRQLSDLPFFDDDAPLGGGGERGAPSILGGRGGTGEQQSQQPGGKGEGGEGVSPSGSGEVTYTEKFEDFEEDEESP